MIILFFFAIIITALLAGVFALLKKHDDKLIHIEKQNEDIMLMLRENAEVIEDILLITHSTKEELKTYMDTLQVSYAEQKKATAATNSFFTGLGNIWNYNPYEVKKEEADE